MNEETIVIDIESSPNTNKKKSRSRTSSSSSEVLVILNEDHKTTVPLSDHLETMEKRASAVYSDITPSSQLIIMAGLQPPKEADVLVYNCIPRRIYDRLWCVPQLRNLGHSEEEEYESPVSWTELFYDLIFVASINNLAEVLKETIEFHGGVEIWLILLYWILFMQTWSTFMFYLTRFKNKDFFSYVIFFFYNSGIVIMAANLITGLSDRKAFSIGYAITRFTAGILYMQVSLNPDARLFGRIAVGGHAFSFLLAIIAAFLPTAGTVTLWVFQPIVEYSWINITYRFKKGAIPVNVHHIIERLGLLTLLVQGESIIALIAGVNTEETGQFVIELIGFFLVFVLRQIYSTSHPLEPSRHALRRSRLYQNLFFYGHIFIGASLLGIGTSVKVLLDQSKLEVVNSMGINLFYYSLGLFLFVLNAVRLSHVHVAWIKKIWAIRAIVILILLILPTISQIKELRPLCSPYAIIFIGTLLLTFVSLVDRFEYDAPKAKQLPKLTRQRSRFLLDTANL